MNEYIFSMRNKTIENFVNILFIFISSFSSVEKLGHNLGSWIIETRSLHSCQNPGTSTVVACTPLPMRGPRAPNEVARFFFVGFLLLITELLRSSRVYLCPSITTEEYFMCQWFIYHTSLIDCYLFMILYFHRFFLFTISFKPYMVSRLSVSNSFQWSISIPLNNLSFLAFQMYYII